jgi:DNA-binding transcriptional LysR family regulator
VDLTLQQLRMLRELASAGTIAATADSLGYTPSAVSQQLSALERAVGQPLLERVGRNVRLTDAGRVLVAHAHTVLDQVEAAQTALSQVNADVRGEIALTVYESVATTLLPSMLTILDTRHPDLRLRTRQVEPGPAVDMLARGEIDMAFTIDYPHAPTAQRDDVVQFAVADDHFHLVVSDDDPVRGHTVALASLTGRSMIAASPESSCGQCILVACRSAGFEPDLVHQLDDYATAMHLVAAGHGIALIPDLGLQWMPPGVRVIDIDPPVRRTIQLAYRRASADRPAVRAVRDVAVEVAAARHLRRVG